MSWVSWPQVSMVDFQAIKESLPENDQDIIDQAWQQPVPVPACITRARTLSLTGPLGCSEHTWLA